MLTVLLLLAQTRIEAAQIEPQPKPPGRTYVTVAQAARLDPRQLAGNVRVLRNELTVTGTGVQVEAPVVVTFPPSQWCTATARRICP